MEANEMTDDYLAATLEELQFSAEMPRQVLGHLAASATLRHISAGTVIFREGNQHQNLYLIRQGRVALEMNVPGRGALRILTLGPGEMLGWSALLDRGKMTATAVAVEDSELIAAPADSLRGLSETNRDFGFHLMRQMAAALSKRLVATRLQLLDLFGETTPGIATNPAEGKQ